ncbi:MAG: PD-(D/E)XK nuclease family protein, partial [Solirubrobacteraceae bacterium]
VFFYGFDDLTRLEQDAVETLARIAGAEVTVSLTYERGRAALAARAQVVEELRPLADEILELPALDTHYAPAARAALHQLERGLFESEPARIDPGPAVALLEAGGERAEVELIAGRILGLLRDGVPGAEIAVVGRSLNAIAPLITRVFAEYGVPLSCASDVLFAHTPLGRAVLGAARCALLDEHEARAEDLLAYLRATGVLARPEVADALEAGLARDGLASAAAARERLGWSLRELDQLAAAADPGAVLCRLARRLQAAPHRACASTLDEVEALDAHALAALVAALDELAELGSPPAGSELLELLQELAVAGERTGGPDDVVLAEPLGIRARRFRIVFVCGLQEGEFPLAARPEPFLSDERRRELAAASGLRLALAEDSLDRERYLLYATVSRATERVLVSYRSSDEEGNLALPSPFLDDLREMFDEGWFDKRERRLLADVVWAPGAAPTERERRRALAAALAPAAGEPEEHRRQLGPVARSRLRHTEILSAGALEAYGDCPVKWLVERELRPAALEPESDPITRGNLIHATLEQLLADLDGPVTPESLPRAREILDRRLSELAAGPGARLGAGRPEIVRAGLLRAIEADLQRYLRHEAASSVGWRPVGLELSFGFEDGERGSLPALELGSGPERVRIRGMIDRVDVDAGGHALIRDYKSGAPRSDWPVARWGPDRRLQVALYLVAVRELTSWEPVAGLYQPLRGDDLRGRGVFVTGTAVAAGVHGRDGRAADEFTAELDTAGERAVALAVALRSGALTPCPQTCSRDGCAFPGICRSQ